MNYRFYLLVKACWFLLAVGTLAFTLYLYDGTPATRDAELILLYGMLTLSFPASQVVVLVLGGIGYLFELLGVSFTIPTNYLMLLIEWIVLLGAGYLQWFVLLPWIWQRFKKQTGTTVYGLVNQRGQARIKRNK